MWLSLLLLLQEVVHDNKLKTNYTATRLQKGGFFLNSMEKNDLDNLWGPISPDSWRTISFIKNQIATEEDVKLGKAVFYIDDQELEHFPIDIEIPKLAYQINQETGEKILSVVIQAEKIGEEEIVGLRYFDGGNGVCALFELEFVNE